MTKDVKLGHMTVKELQEYLQKNQTILIPYALIEQHGFHMPLDTDIRNAEVMGEKIARALGCVMAPTLNYCFSGGMLAGTINVRPNTFSNLVCEIIESLHLQGFRNFIIIPGHGGSESLFHLKESLRILKWLNPALADALILMMTLWDFSPTWLELFKARDYHASDAETSLMRYWFPEAVRPEIVMDEPEIAEQLRNDPDSYQKRTVFTDLKQEIPATCQRSEVKVGVMGYPERSSAATGKKIDEEIMANMIPALQKALHDADEARRSGKCRELVNNDKLKILNL